MRSCAQRAPSQASVLHQRRRSPPQPQVVTQQIAVAVSQTQSQDFEIRLDPEELGKLRIVLSPKDGGYDIMITADRDQTLELIKRNANELADQFEQMGYGGSTMSFASSQDTPTSEDQDDEKPVVASNTLSMGFEQKPITLSEGLDIRY